MNNNEIYSSRILNYPVETVYGAFENPAHLQNWWGPEGFSNTIHEFDLKPGGRWKLTMHGPEQGHYENAAIFTAVEANKRVSWKRETQPYFDMEIAFETLDENKSKISFRMIFHTAAECEKMRPFVLPKNEENFDRLEREILNITR